VLVPTHRIVFALRDGEVVEMRAPSTVGTFGAYRTLPDAVHGMIAWPNTVLLSGPETVVVDPGYATQGDVLEGALRARGLAPDDVRTVLMTHLHSDHVSALPQLGEVDLHVHEIELREPHAHAGRGARDRARERPMTGEAGEVLPGLRWILTPGHTEGHVVFLVDTDEGVTAIAGDTLGPDPAWFAAMDLPEGFPRRDDHLAAFRAIRAQDPAVVIPGHTPPVRLAGG
jgi:N-acyl homoserine lactone hydrolase